MNRYLHKIVIPIVLFISLSACQKEDYTSPVTVNMSVALVEGSFSHLHFDKGIIMFSQILFDGQRDHGGDVHFLTDARSNIGPIQFTDKSAGYTKKFDIPQGIYSYKEWRFELDEIDDDYLESLGEEQLEDLEGGLIIGGTYTKKDGFQLPLYIVVDDDESFKAVSESVNGYGDIALTVDKKYVAALTFDPYYAMQSISIESIETATISYDDDDRPYIEISSDENETLYELVLFRLQKSVKVILN